ncbi:MAG: hydroxymethylglutaryl-CoA lyase [Acidobacteriota bacterium]
MDLILHDVGMRDGLQVEDTVVPLEIKIDWIDRLLTSGIDLIQVGSFVNPKLLPQMADTDAIFRHFANAGGAARRKLTALVLNEKGLERGLEVGVNYFCMGVSASDTHSRKNTGMSTAEASDRIIRMAGHARAAGATVQLSVQSAFGCGYEGHVPGSRVLQILERFVNEGFLRLSLADTAGHATPLQVRRLFGAIRRAAPDATCACHFHDTYGLAVANAYAAMETGVRAFEMAFGGLGGCPFAALAGGNLCTEDFVHLLQREGLRHDVDLEALIEVANQAEGFFARPLPGVVHRTGPVAVVPESSES